MFENNDPFFIGPVKAGQEIGIDLDTLIEEKILLECIQCKKEFDPREKEYKNIPSSNYCSDCYVFEA